MARSSNIAVTMVGAFGLVLAFGASSARAAEGCDNGVPVGGTACAHQGDPVQYRCQPGSQPGQSNWTQESCNGGTCQGAACTAAPPPPQNPPPGPEGGRKAASSDRISPDPQDGRRRELHALAVVPGEPGPCQPMYLQTAIGRFARERSKVRHKSKSQAQQSQKRRRARTGRRRVRLVEVGAGLR